MKKNIVNLSEENQSQGWIGLQRSLRDHWLWDDPIKLKWFLDIVFEVNHSAKKVAIGFQVYDCNKNQSLNSLLTWSKRWRVHESSVRRFLKLLQEQKIILLESLPKTTRLTLLESDVYKEWRRDKESQSDFNAISMQSQSDTNKNDNNSNNEENEKAAAAAEKEISNINNFTNENESNSFQGSTSELKEAKYEKLEKTSKAIYNFIKKEAPHFIEPYTDLWNLFAQKNKKSSVIKNTDVRKKYLTERLKEKEFNFLQILSIASKSTFLLSKHWFTFDWIIEKRDSEKNYLNLLEGKYSDTSSQKNTSVADAIYKARRSAEEAENLKKYYDDEPPKDYPYSREVKVAL